MSSYSSYSNEKSYGEKLEIAIELLSEYRDEYMDLQSKSPDTIKGTMKRKIDTEYTLYKMGDLISKTILSGRGLSIRTEQPIRDKLDLRNGVWSGYNQIDLTPSNFTGDRSNRFVFGINDINDLLDYELENNVNGEYNKLKSEVEKVTDRFKTVLVALEFLEDDE